MCYWALGVVFEPLCCWQCCSVELQTRTCSHPCTAALWSKEFLFLLNHLFGIISPVSELLGIFGQASGLCQLRQVFCNYHQKRGASLGGLWLACARSFCTVWFPGLLCVVLCCRTTWLLKHLWDRPKRNAQFDIFLGTGPGEKKNRQRELRLGMGIGRGNLPFRLPSPLAPFRNFPFPNFWTGGGCGDPDLHSRIWSWSCSGRGAPSFSAVPGSPCPPAMEPLHIFSDFWPSPLSAMTKVRGNSSALMQCSIH
jgi:hypothetical protein